MIFAAGLAVGVFFGAAIGVALMCILAVSDQDNPAPDGPVI